MGVFDKLKSDLALIDGLVRSLRAYRGLTADATITAADDIERSVDRFPDNIAFRFEGASLSYRDLDALAKVLHSEEVPTPFGKIKFDAQGEPVGIDFSIYQVKNGQFVPVK